MNAYPEQSVVCPIMVGRDLPAQALLRLSERVRSGQGQIALVSGEAGIGKSRLVRELRTQIQASTTTILQDNCFETDQTLPYSAIRDLLRTLFTILTPARKSAIFRNSAAELVRLLPELAQDFRFSASDR
jgi:predicted ATPase